MAKDVRFPAAQPHDGLSYYCLVEPHPGIPTSAPKKVVVCDDERHIVRLIRVNLERRGFEVYSAFNGPECLKKVPEIWPDLVVLDREMPGMSGEEVLAELRRHPDTRDIEVIFFDRKSRNDDSFPGDGPTITPWSLRTA